MYFAYWRFRIYRFPHTATILAENNQKFLIVDNFTNCKKDVVDKLEKITKQKVHFCNVDVRDTERLIKIIKENQVSSVIHFAALKSVSDSLIKPLEYYEVNVKGTISLLQAMQYTDVKGFFLVVLLQYMGNLIFVQLMKNIN